MASTSSLPEEDLSCPVCCDIFKDPVVLSCGHIFCDVCLKEWWNQKNVQQCPVCKEIHTTDHLSRNPALKTLCEAFRQERQRVSKQERQAKHQRIASRDPEDLCGLHTEKLKLFCLECRRPVCAACRDSEEHAEHSFTPIKEAARDHKKGVQKSLAALKKKLKLFNKVKENCDQTAEHLKAQAQHTEQKIKEQFEKLHQFLREEEEARITALREEEQQKSHVMKETMEDLSRDILTLSNNIRDMEEDLGAEHMPFLQNHVDRVQQLTLQDPQPVSGALIDVAKHLGNLSFRVWDKMKDLVVRYTPVVLDPNTANVAYALSDDLTSVRHAKTTRPLPDNPERFDQYGLILGSRGFGPGDVHRWDVLVGDNTQWRLGVLEEPYQRKGDAGGHHWRIGLQGGRYSAGSRPGTVTDLELSRDLQAVRVQLNWSGGTVAFSDPHTGALIHSFTHNFTGTLYPFINTGQSQPLKMGAATIRVALD